MLPRAKGVLIVGLSTLAVSSLEQVVVVRQLVEYLLVVISLI